MKTFVPVMLAASLFVTIFAAANSLNSVKGYEHSMLQKQTFRVLTINRQ